MSEQKDSILQINGERLWATLMQLKEIGVYDDAATGLRGVKRLALTDEDDQARRLVVSARDLDLGFVEAMSGAGHDAQEIAAICPTAMVFVAGEYGGISHTPREYSSPEACANGTNLLANAIRRLADEPV